MNDSTTASSTSSPRLLRALGPLTATAVVVGTVIGSGIFKKPQSIAANVPDFTAVALVWIAGGVLALLGSLALAEVAVLFPKAGGNYVFLREGFGRLAGFLWGWVEFWIIRAGSLAALATIFSESFHDILRETLRSGSNEHLLSSWEQRLLTVSVILALALVNILGVRWGGLLQLVITLVKIGSLLAITVLPFVFLALDRSATLRMPPEFTGVLAVVPDAALPAAVSWGAVGQLTLVPERLQLAGFLTALLGALWAYHGWMNIAPIAEEVKNPNRNIPLALFAGTAIVVLLYLGANLAYHLVLPQGLMASLKDTTVVAEFSLSLLGPIGAVLASAAVMCSVFGALNGNLLVGPRLLYAMGEDRLAPRALGAIHPRFRTPALAIVLMAVWACVLVLAAGTASDLKVTPTNKPLFDILTDYAMFGAIIFETLAVATIFIFRWKLPQLARPYRCWGYPWVPALYMILPILVVGNYFVSQQAEAAAGVGFIVLGGVVYYVLLRKSRT